MDGWGVWSYRIVLVGLEELRNITYFFVICIQKIFVGCRHVDKIIGIRILDIITDLLQLEMHCFGFIGYIGGDKGNNLTYIVEDGVEHFAWVMWGGIS